MVQRYELEEMSRNPFESYRCLEDNEEGDWVKYADYLAIHALMCRLTDQFNLCEIPDDLYEALEAAGIL
ncbi:MAG: hypothetical protein [Caudoviricetes sp.]|nr:MAG: hypothetical protein [Caudoviricetes sp.]